MIKPQIILLEDNVRLNKLIEVTLNVENYEVHPFFSAKKARNFIINWKEDFQKLFLVMDYSLPDAETPEFICSMRKIEKLPPFMVISGYSDPEIIVKVMRLGAVNYLVKTPDFAKNLSLALKEYVARVDGNC